MTHFLPFWRRIFDAVQTAIFPTRCLVCGDFFRVPPGIEGLSTFDALMGDRLCRSCAADFRPIRSPLCTRCGAMFKSQEGEDRLCGGCIHDSKPFTRARAAGLYEGALLKLVHLFKYRRRTELAAPLGRLLLAAFSRHWAPGTIDVIVPVPLHGRKFRQRGFNQAYLLVRRWDAALEATSGALSCPVELKALHRSRWTESQAGLGKQDRLINIRGAFRPGETAPIAGRTVLLVDDVYTTGATVGECARVLRESGARQVDVLTLARAA